MLGARHLLHVPRLLVLDQGMENRQELAHTGREGDLGGFPGGAQAMVEGRHNRVVPDGGDGGHVEHGAHVGAAAPDGAAPPEGPAVVVQGRL